MLKREEFSLLRSFFGPEEGNYNYFRAPRKGKWLIFHFQYSDVYGDVIDTRDSKRRSRKSYLFFLTGVFVKGGFGSFGLDLLKDDSYVHWNEITSRGCQMPGRASSICDLSACLRVLLENLVQRTTFEYERTENRIRSPRLVASGELEECRLGKSAKL